MIEPCHRQSTCGNPLHTHLLPSLRHSKKPSMGMTQRFHLTRRENTGFSHTVSDLAGGTDEYEHEGDILF